MTALAIFGLILFEVGATGLTGAGLRWSSRRRIRGKTGRVVGLAAMIVGLACIIGTLVFGSTTQRRETGYLLVGCMLGVSLGRMIPS
jgi:hypothetical protein